MTGHAPDPGGHEADGHAPDPGEHPGGSGARSAAFALTGLALALGVIGVSIGFATLLGIAATAAGGDAAGYGTLAVTAATSLILGILLIIGAALLWRAHRSARVVIWVALTLLIVSSIVRILVDEVTFISVVGTVLSLCALTAMVTLLVGDGVREHVRAGIPLRLR